MARCDDETEGESESLRETGVVGTSMMKNLKKVLYVSLIALIFHKGKWSSWGGRGYQGVGGGG